VTWQLTSFAILALALAAGFAWYEHARPTAKVVALVATLAALAALGRIAFAPIPSVKPTTDIVLISGYVLGGAPGFVVGAVAALASNVFFGQGPFTPWQMAGWGAVGVFGALLARGIGPNISRWGLATACAIAGFAYGAFLDFHLWVLYAGEHSTSEYLVLAGRGLPFNIGHAAGNLVFCLAFGPLLVRALRRYRDRLEVVWHPLEGGPATTAAVLGALVVALAAVAFAAGPGASDAQAASPAARAIGYLDSVQNANGGFPAGGGGPSTQLNTSWAVMGIAAAGRDPDKVRDSGKSGADYMVKNLGQIRGIADLERTILALRSAGHAVAKVKGRNLAHELVAKRRANGSFAGLVNQTSFAILALRATGRSRNDAVIRKAVSWLAPQHNGDGGFNFAQKGGPSGIDDTAAALQALAAAGQGATKTAKKAATFLVSQQNADGGMPLKKGGQSNAQSTSWAVQALVAARRNVNAIRVAGGRTPLEYLRSLQNASGSFRYSRTSSQSPVWVTAQVLTALARRPFPISAP
jgi:energy-coupling factor transport system substrate-specific component